MLDNINFLFIKVLAMNETYIAGCEYSTLIDGVSEQFRIGFGYYLLRGAIRGYFVRFEAPFINNYTEYNYPLEKISEALGAYESLKSTLGGK